MTFVSLQVTLVGLAVLVVQNAFLHPTPLPLQYPHHYLLLQYHYLLLQYPHHYLLLQYPHHYLLLQYPPTTSYSSAPTTTSCSSPHYLLPSAPTTSYSSAPTTSCKSSYKFFKFSYFLTKLDFHLVLYKFLDPMGPNLLH
jgi:hypothetical protein